METQPPIYRLPEELLLQIAGHLRAYHTSAELVALRNVCLVSKKLYPIAQEQLFAGAILPVSCGCHPKVNAVVQLLRTLLERPELAGKVKHLRFSIVRRSVTKIYKEKNYDLCEIRNKCFAKLSELSYQKGHPWWTSLVNDIESAYGGVLLTLIPNVEKLDFNAKDHHRGWPTTDPISAFYGTSAAPTAMVNALKSLHTLVAVDLSFIRELEFAALQFLNLKRTNLVTVLRLNGPHSLRGVTQLKELSLGLSIQFLHEECLGDMDAGLGDLFAALACSTLRSLRIVLTNDAYSIDTDPVFKVKYFMHQMKTVSSTLQALAIDLDPDDDDEWHWFLNNVENPIGSFKKFPELRQLGIPQDFLFRDFPDGFGILPVDLPPKLEHLEVITPDDDIVDWTKAFMDTAVNLPYMKKITLKCRASVNFPAAVFCEDVSEVWPELHATKGIEGFAHDCATGEENSLVVMYEVSPEENSDEEVDDEDVDMDSEEHDVPPLVDVEVADDETDIPILVDDVD